MWQATRDEVDLPWHVRALIASTFGSKALQSTVPIWYINYAAYKFVDDVQFDKKMRYSHMFDHISQA
jgi:hypothetical protein